MFIHESPSFADKYIKNIWSGSENHLVDIYKETWSGGANHFVDNNFALFKERYSKIIDNFRNYLNSNVPINFIIARYNQNITSLTEVFKNKYPNLKYSTIILEPDFIKSALYVHYKLMFIEDEGIKVEF